MNRLLVAALLLILSFAGSICAANEGETDDRGVLLVIARAPLKAREWKNPYAGDAQARIAGEKLFRQHCAECHGDDATGIGHAANLHSSGVQLATPGELAWFLRNGNPAKGMPAWSGISEQRRWQIVVYLKTLP